MIIQAYIEKLDFIPRSTNVSAQKIDSLPLKIYGMVTTGYLVYDKLDRPRFFEKTFLLVDISMEVVLEMSFLFLNNANLQFSAKKLIWSLYITVEALPTIK